MYGYNTRWLVRDETVGPDKYEAKEMGWKLVRKGSLRRYYRMSDNLLMAAYSYNTCIMARMDPSEEFPLGRIVVNETSYSMMSNKHFWALRRDFNRWLYTTLPETDSLYGFRYSFEVECTEWTHRAIVIDCRREINETDLVLEVYRLIDAAPYTKEMMQRNKEMRIRDYNREVDEYNDNLAADNVIAVNFQGD